MASTDSAWGAKRIDSDVLVHKPDVVFVEFAVNDGNRESSQDMERIVRKIHAANPESEIVFIYTTSDSAFRKLMSGQIPFAIAQHEKVAEHYQIPALVFGADLASRIESGEWKWLDFSNDACHPTIAGYESYSRDLLLSFDRFLQAANRIQSRFPEPLCDNFQLRPSKIELSCIANSEALSDGNGNPAIQTERMPVFGLQWIDEPFYQTPSGSSWRLEYAVFSGMPNHADGSLLKANWLPARWFEEGRGFTGERSRILARGNLTSNELCVPPYLLPRSVEVPQVRWEAGQGGECLIDISIAKIEGHVNGAPALAGVDLLIHRQGEKMEALASITGENAKPLHLRHPVRLLEGDAIVIRPFAKGYEYLNLKNFDFVVGFFENPPIP
jgi:hypothetical protein